MFRRLKMKKIIYTLILLFIATIVYSQPFLVCDDPGEGKVDMYVLSFDAGEEIETPYPLHYDVSHLEPGKYVVTAKAVKGIWASDPSVPLEFEKPSLPKPTLSLSIE